MLDIDISGHQVQKSYAQFRGPRNIMLDITKRCNFFCKHCYNESASYYTGDLDDESMMKIADQIIEMQQMLIRKVKTSIYSYVSMILLMNR